MAVLKALQNETVEQMIYRHYGRQDADLLDAVIDDKRNLGLAALGLLLPLGTEVYMPPETSGAPATTVAADYATNLWD